MLLSLYSYDGVLLNDSTNYNATIPPGNSMPAANPEFVNRGSTWPKLAGKTLSGATFTFKVIFRGTIHTQLEALKALFRVDDFTPRQLIAFDTSDSNRAWYVMGYPVQPPLFENSEGGGSVIVTLALEEPIWREYVQQSDTWSVVATGATRAITTRGNIETPPVFEITPTVAKVGGYAYKRYVIVYNKTARPFAYYPLNLVGDWNTSTLIAGGKMQADGDDLRVNVDGVEASRWIYNINSTTTRVWANINLRPKVEFTLGANIAISGLADITVANTTANIAALKTLQASGALLIDNEVILYNGVNVSTRKITPTARAAMNTTAATHTSGATIRFIEHTILVYYGNSAVSAPYVNDNVKPMFGVSSSNTLWEYTDFADRAKIRRFIWNQNKRIAAGAASYHYFGDHGSLSDDPAVEAGLLIGCYQQTGVWRAGQGDLDWTFYHPAGITNIAASGEKYKGNASWPTAKLQKSAGGATWADIAAITVPASVTTWTAWTVASTALGAGTWLYVRFLFSGTVNAGTSIFAAMEMSAISVTLDSAGVPSVTMQAEQDNYSMDVKITNTTTGEYFTVGCVMGLNETITVDCENLRVYNSDGQNLHGALDRSSKRTEFLTLKAGANTIQFDDTGTAAVTVMTKWRARSLL